jgi:hypothetical protein
MLAEAMTTASAENRSRTSEDSVTATVSAHIALIDLAGETMVSAAPQGSVTKVLGIYDGTFDFSGESGATFLGLNSSDSVSKAYFDIAALLSFTGVGTSTFAFEANSLSKVVGGGNLISTINTVAGGNVSIEYTFSEAIDVLSPAHFTLLGAGLLAVFAWRKAKG